MVFQGNQKLKSMDLAVSLDLPLSLGIKSSRTEPSSGKDGKKKNLILL